MAGRPFPVAIDIETTGLDFTSDKIRGVGIYVDSTRKAFHTDLDNVRRAIEQLRDEGAFFVMQNGKFDVKFLWKAGIEIECDFDTMLAAYLLPERPKSLSLASLASYYLGMPSWKSDFEIDAPLEVLGPYCLTDCEMTLNLHRALSEKLVEVEQDKFFIRFMEVAKLLAEVEYTGMAVNWHALETLMYQLEAEIAVATSNLDTTMAADIAVWQNEELLKSKVKKPKPKTFNWGSPAQVLWMLKRHNADVMVWMPGKRAKCESSNTDVLQKNKGLPFVELLSDLRTIEKLYGGLDGYREIRSNSTGRIHCNFNLHITDTGRLSSSNPNLQNVDKSRRVRGLFTCSPGTSLLIGDLAQIEVRMAAHYSRDPKLIRMFQNEEDFYGTIAVELLGATCTPNEVKAKFPALRNVAKTIGLSVLYGVGPNRLKDGIERETGIKLSIDEARQFIRRYFERFEGLKELRMRVDHKLTKDGYLTNLFGRRINVGGDDIYMHGVNYLLQSSASDLMLFRQLEVERAAKSASLDQRLICLVHDEMLREVTPEHVAPLSNIVKKTLENITDIELRVPLKIELAVGQDWSVKN